MAVPTSITNLSTTASSNSPAGTDSVGTTLDDYLRAIQGILKTTISQGSTITAASTITPGDGNYFEVSGSTGITAIGSTNSWNGREIVLKFSSTPALTHSSNLILPGSANITCAAGDVASFVQESSGTWRCSVFQKANGEPVSGVGKQTIWIPAAAMTARVSNGAAVGTTETSTYKVVLKTLDFDQSTDEFAQFDVRMPKSWNEGTVTAYFLWSSAISGTNAVVWGLQGVAISDGDALDVAWGTAQTVTDSQVTGSGYLMQSAETSAITIAGTPAAGDWVKFQVYRDADNGSDTLAGDARLHGVVLIYTTDAINDA